MAIKTASGKDTGMITGSTKSTPAAAPSKALSTIASSAGVRVDKLGVDEGVGALNVDALNKIAEKRAIQQTTTERRKQTQNRLTQHDATMAKGKETVDSGYAPDPELDKYDPTNTTAVKSDINNIRVKAEQDINSITSKLASIENSMDDASRMMIEGIKQKYSGLVAEMRDKNKRVLEVKRDVGFRQGRERYTPGLQAGIIADEEVDGAYRISQLQGEMVKLVMDAEQARGENKIKIFNQQYDRIDAVQKTMKEEIKNIYTTILDREKNMRDQEKAQRDQEKADWDKGLEASKRAAPALTKALKGLSDPTARANLISTYAERMGIDSNVLLGDITEAMDEQTKRDLDIRNIESQMSNRDEQLALDKEQKNISRANLAVSQGHLAIAQRDQALKEKEVAFKPTADQRALVGRYLQSEKGRSEFTGSVALTNEELAEVMNDQTLFYAVLDKAEKLNSL